MRVIGPDNERDRLKEACVSNYEGRGLFTNSGWPEIAVAIAEECIGGQGWSEFMMEFPPREGLVEFDIDLVESLTNTTSSILLATAIVAPAVQGAASRAVAEHWTTSELLARMRTISEESRPRVQRLAVDGD